MQVGKRHGSIKRDKKKERQKPKMQEATIRVSKRMPLIMQKQSTLNESNSISAVESKNSVEIIGKEIAY